LIEAHPDGLILVPGGSSGTATSPNFFYLTGVEEPRAVLMLAAKGIRIGTGANYPGPDYVRGRLVEQLLFLPSVDPLAQKWGEDSAATVDSLSASAAGVDGVLSLGELDSILDRTLSVESSFHYVRGRAPSLGGQPDADVRFVAQVRERFFGVKVTDATPTVREARRSKDETEVEAIERAVALTACALARVVKMIGPDVSERTLAAEIGRVYSTDGATHAFDPIVGAGRNALSLHYTKNSGRLEAGQLVLIDTGASLAGYKSDVTRTYPVDGRFTSRQREVYQTVLQAMHEAIAECKPGALLAEIHATAYRVIDEAGFGQAFIHGTSHHLGLETHDVGDVHIPLKTGAVVTVEPGIYLEDEGIGVRIEEDVLVTPAGPKVLSLGIPSTVDAIESSMA
jgi:Xaa-Pro aminopeptidase